MIRSASCTPNMEKKEVTQLFVEFLDRPRGTWLDWNEVLHVMAMPGWQCCESLSRLDHRKQRGPFVFYNNIENWLENKQGIISLSSPMYKIMIKRDVKMLLIIFDKKRRQKFAFFKSPRFSRHPGGSRNTPSRFMLLKPEIRAGLMGHLARMQTLPLLYLYRKDSFSAMNQFISLK